MSVHERHATSRWAGDKRFRTVPAAVWVVLFWLVLGAPALEATERFEFFGDRTTVTLTEDRERTVLEGNAGIRSEDLVIEADRVEIYGAGFRYAVAIGNVELVDTKREFTLSSERLRYDRDSENLQAEGSVVLEDERNAITVRGGFLEYRSDEELMVVQAAVRIYGEDLETRSQLARYRRDTEVLELSGVPEVRRGEDDYRAMRIVIDLDRDEVTMHGRVSGAIGSRAEDEPGEEADEEAAEEPAAEESADEPDEPEGGARESGSSEAEGSSRE